MTTTTMPRPQSADDTAGPSPQPRRERDPLLDNAKFLAIVLVVVGHTWTDLRGNPRVEAAYDFVYLFHIPVFVLLAGYLSRSFRLTFKGFYKLAAALLIPYVLFETAYETLTAWVNGDPVRHNATAPSWVMWFLPALFIWRLSVPVWRRMPAVVAVSLAIGVSLWGGLGSNDDYAWSKTLSLLPFFVIGIMLRREHLEMLRGAKVRIAAAVVALVAAGACLLSASSFDIGLARWKYSYAELGSGTLDGAAARLGVVAVALVLSAAFLAIIPGRRGWYTAWGANTMYSYLLHGAVIQAAIAVGVFGWSWVSTDLGALLVTVAAAAVGALLMAPWIKRLFRPVVEPGPRGDRDCEDRYGADDDLSWMGIYPLAMPSEKHAPLPVIR